MTHEELLDLIEYDPVTGIFIRKSALTHKQRVGKPLGTLNQGRLHIYCKGKTYQAGRLAWFYIHGVWPTGLIDHVDGNPLNNTISNLREASHQENIHNQQKAHRNNRSGTIGVELLPNGKYRARVNDSGKYLHLGVFTSKEDAYSAYSSTKSSLHPFFAGVTK